MQQAGMVVQLGGVMQSHPVAQYDYPSTGDKSNRKSLASVRLLYNVPLSMALVGQFVHYLFSSRVFP